MSSTVEQQRAWTKLSLWMNLSDKTLFLTTVEVCDTFLEKNFFPFRVKSNRREWNWLAYMSPYVPFLSSIIFTLKWIRMRNEMRRNGRTKPVRRKRAKYWQYKTFLAVNTSARNCRPHLRGPIIKSKILFKIEKWANRIGVVWNAGWKRKKFHGHNPRGLSKYLHREGIKFLSTFFSFSACFNVNLT